MASPEVPQQDHGDPGDAREHAPEPAQVEPLMAEQPRQDPDDEGADRVEEAHVRVRPQPRRIEEEALIDRHAEGRDRRQPGPVAAEQPPEGAPVGDEGEQAERREAEPEERQDADGQLAHGHLGEGRGGRTEERP